MNPIQKSHETQTDTRAVSELIGYTLTLGTVIFVLILITAGTIPIFDAAESNEAVNNMETNFNDISDTHAEIEQHGVERTTNDIRLPPGQFYITPEDSAETIEISNNNGQTEQFETRPLIFLTGNNEQIVYMNGIIASDIEGAQEPFITRHGTFISRDDPIQFRNHAYTNTETESDVSTRSRTQTYNLDASENQRENRSSEIREISGTDLTITIDTEHPEIWRQYFESHTSFTNVQIQNNGQQITADADTTAAEETIRIHETEFELEFVN